jgi:hypothetical protein
VTGIVGLLFLLLGLALFAWVLFGPPQAVLEISADRLALRGRAGLLWELPWPAVAGLHLVRAGSEVQTWKARSGLGIRVTWARHYLVVNLREGTKRPAGLHGTRGRQGVVNLGVLPGTARAVAAALGARLGDPQPEHLDAQHSAATRRAGN